MLLAIVKHLGCSGTLGFCKGAGDVPKFYCWTTNAPPLEAGRAYTPFALLVLHGWWSSVILGLAWAGAAFGIAIKLLSLERLRVLGGAMYIVLGWLVIIAMPQLVHGMSPVGVALLFAGGALYTLGAVVLWRRWPDPNPRWFGYHEVWHTMVVTATLCHYAAIMLLLRG